VPPNVAAPNPALPNPAPPAAGHKETRVAWVPPGPDPPVILSEAEDRWSEAFRSRDCDVIAELGPARGQQTLYGGLGDACRAVLDEDEEDDRLWASAEAALGDVHTPSDCLDRLAWGLLRDLVVAHRRAPDADIQIEDAEIQNVGHATLATSRACTIDHPDFS
jgi:hypothetical protein